jgi:hypothetical protein
MMIQFNSLLFMCRVNSHKAYDNDDDDNINNNNVFQLTITLLLYE